MISDLPPVDGEGRVDKVQRPFEQALAPFLQQGGGVIAFCTGSGFSNTNRSLNHLLRPYGAAVPEEQVTDPQHVFGPIGDYAMRCFTTQIEKGPMTKGIRRLGYLGQASRADCIEMMMPVVISDKAAWHAVVRGEKTAYSAEGKNRGSGPQLKDTPATYAAYPVLAAWREVGRGRLFVFPLNPSFTTGSPEVFRNLLWDKDDQAKPGAMPEPYVPDAGRALGVRANHGRRTVRRLRGETVRFGPSSARSSRDRTSPSTGARSPPATS